MRLETLGSLALVAGVLATPTAAGTRDAKPTLWYSFILEISSNGKAMSNQFELWWLSGRVAPYRAGTTAPLVLTSVIFLNAGETTDVVVELHETLGIDEIQPGLFRLRFSGNRFLGNGKGCSDLDVLDVIMSYSPDYATLQDLSGSARGGVNCEYTYTYRLSRERMKPIAPLRNGLYLAFPSLLTRH